MNSLSATGSREADVSLVLASVTKQLSDVLSRIESIEKAHKYQSLKHTDILSKLVNQKKTSGDISKSIKMFPAKVQ